MPCSRENHFTIRLAKYRKANRLPKICAIAVQASGDRRCCLPKALSRKSPDFCFARQQRTNRERQGLGLKAEVLTECLDVVEHDCSSAPSRHPAQMEFCSRVSAGPPCPSKQTRASSRTRISACRRSQAAKSSIDLDPCPASQASQVVRTYRRPLRS